MTDPIRSALKRLLSAVLDGLGQDDHPMGWARVDDAIDAARAALAEPDGPTLQLPEQAPDEHPPSNLDRREVAAWYHGHACGWQAARAALARFGHQPAPPAVGEVGELVAKLRRLAPQNPLGTADPTITRAADLLVQRHPTPVPASDRLPQPEDCDAEGRCWWGFEETDDYEASWTLRKMIGLPFDGTHWLPATALPLPACTKSGDSNE